MTVEEVEELMSKDKSNSITKDLEGDKSDILKENYSVSSDSISDELYYLFLVLVSIVLIALVSFLRRIIK